VEAGPKRVATAVTGDRRPWERRATCEICPSSSTRTQAVCKSQVVRTLLTWPCSSAVLCRSGDWGLEKQQQTSRKARGSPSDSTPGLLTLPSSLGSSPFLDHLWWAPFAW
jgi:hypothetical protein